MKRFFLSVLIEGLNFANGLTLSKEEDFLLVLESGKQRIWKYHLIGEKEGQSEIFSDAISGNLPGTPDNITPNGEDGYFVGIIFPMKSEGIDKLLKHLRSFHPIIRLVVRLVNLVHVILQFVNDFIIQNDLVEILGNIKTIK